MNTFKKDNKRIMRKMDIVNKLVLNDKLMNLHDDLGVKGYVKKFKLSNEIVGDCKHYSDIKANVKKCYEKGDFDFDSEHRCACGKEGLKYLYIVKFENDNSLLVGSSCIKKYKNDKMNDKVKELTKQKEIKAQLKENVNKCWSCKKGAICDYHSKQSKLRIKKLLRFCKKKDCKALVMKGQYKNKCFNCKNK